MGSKSTLLKILSLFAVTLILIPFSYWIFVSIRLETAYRKSTFPMAALNKNCTIFIDKKITEKIDLNIFRDSLENNVFFYNLSYQEPIIFIICKNDGESGIIFPLFKTKASGFAFARNLIVINYDNLQKLGYTLKSIIKHESSHALLKQNIKSFFTIMWTFSHNSIWFSEGLAIYNQDVVILSIKELKKACEGSVIKYFDNYSNFNVSPQNYRIDYSVYYYFMDYLIKKYGKDKMLGYMKLMILKYESAKENFKEVFHSDLKEEIEIFVRDVLGIPVL
jgi:hypothetical protein